MSESKPRYFSADDAIAREAVIFQKRLQSLPPDEQEAFRMYRHPCQEKDLLLGLIVARCCAQVLYGEIKHHKEVRRVEPACDSEGWVLCVVLNSDVWKWERVYRGYKVYPRRERENPQTGILQVVLSWLRNISRLRVKL
jgi:hypothetical protein